MKYFIVFIMLGYIIGGIIMDISIKNKAYIISKENVNKILINNGKARYNPENGNFEIIDEEMKTILLK